MFNRCKKGGSTDIPYKGYKLCYGSKNKDEIIALGGIPLVYAPTQVNVVGYPNFKSNSLEITIDGVKYAHIKADSNMDRTSGGNCHANVNGLKVDVETYYNGDLEKCKNAIVYYKVVGEVYVKPMFPVCKWLEPIK